MKRLTAIVCVYLLVLSAGAQQKLFNESEADKTQRMAWWKDARFGMFIHWGLYALPARHEWVNNNEKMTNEVSKIFRSF